MAVPKKNRSAKLLRKRYYAWQRIKIKLLNIGSCKQCFANKKIGKACIFCYSKN